MKSADAYLITIQDEFFGPLIWEPLCDYWVGAVAVSSGSTLRVYVDTPDGPRNQSVTPASRAAFSRVFDAQAAFKQKAAVDLLAIHNEAWRHEGVPPLSSTEFEQRLTLEGIHVYASGHAEAYYDDGGLFWGHLVSVSQEPDGTFAYEARFDG